MESDQKHADEKIWRYMSLAKFVSLLSRSALWFTRADTFEDKWEGLSRAIPCSCLADEATADEHYKRHIRIHAKWRRALPKRSFVNCWTMEADSIPMWRIYGSYDGGIAVQTSVEKFRQSVQFPKEFPARTMGPVLYYDSMPPYAFDYSKDTQFSWEKEFELILQKRPSYSFEREWRAVIVGSPRDTAKGTGIWVPVGSVDDLIERVLVSPLAPNWFLTDITELANTFKLKATPEPSAVARPRPKQNPAIRRAATK